MAEKRDDYILTFTLADGKQVAARFQDINDRDGCDISLHMYESNLGPVGVEVWERMLRTFHGEWLHGSESKIHND